MRFKPDDPMSRYVGDFYPDKNRVLEALLYLMNKRSNLSQFQLVKAIFLADRFHFNEVGRPVTFDNYVAMELGPVPSLTYDLLKPAGLAFGDIYRSAPPWSATPQGRYYRFRAARKPNLEVLSETDLEALDYGLGKVLTLTKDELYKILHDDPAYKQAWSRRGRDQKRADMPAIGLLDKQDDALVANLAYATRA
jgi:hypothetical protein